MSSISETIIVQETRSLRQMFWESAKSMLRILWNVAFSLDHCYKGIPMVLELNTPR